jgi:hypothetical protein
MSWLNRSDQPGRRAKADIGKRKAVQERIRHIEEAIGKAREYLETGREAHWPGFHPLFVNKVKDGELCAPHKDWVRNVFIPRCERALRHAEKVLQRMEA